MLEIVKHPVSGERYIFQEGGDILNWYLAAGPIYHADAYTQEQMKEYLDQQPLDQLLQDGEWLAIELGYIKL